MSVRLPERSSLALIKGKPVRYRVRRSRRTRKMGIQVCKRDGLVIILPERMGLKVVPELLEYWADWIDTKADEYDIRQGPRVRQFATGSVLSILGKPRHLAIVNLPNGRKRPVIDLTDDSLTLALAPADVFDVRPVMEKYLRRLARQDLTERTAIWADRIGLFPRKVIVGERTSRWGSCSARGTLSFCYRLVMAPPEAVDAVVAHEICHLAHLNHSRRFYSLLDRVCPDHRESMKWLREHEDDLLL
ncbi:MAG: M48 family metallopeptidase [Candidatus Krumholzibacteria bacterium]|nr:M48 family metallopeptidase [Candidatus Krumholzibacteria bacterium]